MKKMATEKQEEGLSPGRYGSDNYSFRVLDITGDDFTPISTANSLVQQSSYGVQVNDANRVLVLAKESGNYVAKVSSFSSANPQDYRNTSVYDPSNGVVCSYDDDGLLFESDDYSLEEFESRLSTLESFTDYFNNADLVELVLPLFKKDSGEQSKVEIPIESTISPEGLELLRINPPLYKEICIKSKGDPLKKEDVEELLLMYAMFKIDEIPEVFTIIEKEPYSDIIKDYLDILATLVSEAMEINDEIDSIEGLELEAYKKAGCRDSIENVRARKEEFQDYFRYRLIKDEKYCISKDRYESIISLSKVMSSNININLATGQAVKKDKIYFRKSLIKPNSSRIGTRACVDLIKLDELHKTIRVSLLKRINGNLEDFIDVIPTLNLDVKMAIISELIDFEFKSLLDRTYKVVYNFIVVDKNDLFFLFEIKAGTFTKWKKKMGEQLNKADWHIKNDSFKLPYEFMNNNMSI